MFAPDRPSTAQPAEGSKSVFSKFLRRDNKNHTPSESKGLGPVSSVCDLRSQPAGTSALYAELFEDPPFDKSHQANLAKKHRSRSTARAGSSKSPMKPVPNSSVFPSSPSFSKPASANQYRCIVCQEPLSSKGVCKRHLDEQHVSPKLFECERCSERFLVKKDAKNHCDECGQGVFLYTVTKPEQKKFYACEFTGECFVSKSKYVEHLLALSEKMENRPVADPGLKLRAILDQSALQQHVSDLSFRMFKSRTAWRNLQWTESQISKAVAELDYANVNETGTIEFGKYQKRTRDYLESLFGTARLPRSNSQQSRRSRSSTVTQRRSPSGPDDGRRTPTQDSKLTMQPPMQPPWGAPRSTEASSMDVNMSISAPEAIMATMSAEIRSKRHLSDQSRAFHPERYPPGPPVMAQIPYSVGPTMPDMGYPLPNNNSATSLPYRSQEGPHMVDQISSDMYSMRTASTAPSTVAPTLSSDTASESTMISSFRDSYHEPEGLDQRSFDCPLEFWNPPPNTHGYPFHFDGSNIDYSMSAPQLPYANGDMSARASSIATDQTYVGHYSEQDQKYANFEQIPPHNTAQYGGTFFLDDNDEFSRS